MTVVSAFWCLECGWPCSLFGGAGRIDLGSETAGGETFCPWCLWHRYDANPRTTVPHRGVAAREQTVAVADGGEGR